MLLQTGRLVALVPQIIPSEIEELITREPLVAHLATCSDSQPHVAPLWYRYTDGVVEILTTGQKLANIRKNPHVALSIQNDENGVPQWMVSLQGTARVIDDEEKTHEANRRLNRKYGIDEDSWTKNVLVRIDVRSTSYRTYS
jgi:nitroimidazol reductase NimA-like FMN-containing flavoprotein (pyridoxamine 5'-phosphate oxidase superfamily)